MKTLALPALLAAPAMPEHAESSDGVAATASTIPGHDGKALCLDWDFAKVSGYAQTE